MLRLAGYLAFSGFILGSAWAAGNDHPIRTYDERVAARVDAFEKNRAEKLDPNEIPYFLMERWVLNQVVLDPVTIIGDVGVRASRMGDGTDQFHRTGTTLYVQQYGHHIPRGRSPVLGLGMVEILTRHSNDRALVKRQHFIRMVRSPRPAGHQGATAEQRGTYVWDLFKQLRAQAPDVPLNQIVRQIPFERFETKLEHCKPAQQALEQLWSLKFAPVKEADVSRYTGMVEVQFSAAAEQSTYQGKPSEEGTPAEWAVKFVEALEPCWKRVEGDFSVDLE